MKIIGALLLSLLSLNSFAGKILVTGEPLEIEVNRDVYTFPDTYTERNKDLHFLTIMGIERVCFLKQMPQLESLDAISINILEHNRKLPWICYKFDSRFFERDF